MKRIGLAGIYEWGILVVLFLVVIHAPFAVSAGTVFPEYSSVLKAWKEIAIALLGVLAVVLVSRRKLWTVLLRDWTIRLAAAFILLHLVFAFLLGGDTESVIAGLMIDLRFVSFFALAYILVLVRPSSVKRIVMSVTAGAAVVIGFGLLQITVLPDDVLRPLGYSRETITPFTTIDSNPDYVRINSTLRGPNPLGAVAVIYAALSFTYLATRGRKHVVALAGLVSSIAVLLASFSRSAYIALIVALGIIGLSLKRLSRRFILAGLTVAVIAAGGLTLVSSTDWYSNVILHEDPESMVVSKSNDGHIDSFWMGLDRAVKQPLGAGVGSTGSASLYDDDTSNDAIIENYYFFVAHESGWLGLALFMGLFYIVMSRLWNHRSGWASLAVFASGAGLAVIGILLPVWADETVALIWWGLAGALVAHGGIIGGRHGRETTGKQASARTT